VTGICLVVVTIILFFTPTSIFPRFGVGTPPVDIVKERSGLRCDGYSTCNYEVYVINRSNEEQRIVVLVKSSLDYDPRRSAPITLGPNQSSVVRISPSVQPSMSTTPSAAVDALSKWNYVGVEYAEGSLPSGSPQAFGAHLILQITSLLVGLALLAAAQKMSTKRPRMTESGDDDSVRLEPLGDGRCLCSSVRARCRRERPLPSRSEWSKMPRMPRQR
jgi:hypothetical protein